MTETFIVHIERHCGWHTTIAEGDTFGEAAISAVVTTCKQFGLDLDTIPHTVEYLEEDINQTDDSTFHSRRVRFYETSERSVFDPFIARGWTTTKPGDIWFGRRVEEGKPGDCLACGGTSVEFGNPFRGCWKCTDGERRTKTSAAAHDHAADSLGGQQKET